MIKTEDKEWLDKHTYVEKLPPYNAISGNEYSGSNQVILTVAGITNKYSSSSWLTFLQAKNSGRKIKKGEHGQTIVKAYSQVEEVEGDKSTIKSIPTGYATVFNLDQTEKI